MKTTTCLSAVLGAVLTVSGVSIVSPQGGETVNLLSDVQREILALPTMRERSDYLKHYCQKVGPDRRTGDWNQAKPLVLRWKPEVGDKGPWEVRIGTRPDLSDARLLHASDSTTPLQTNEDGVIVFTLPRANLEIGRTYHWRVAGNIICGKWGHIRGQCGCTNVVARTSETAAFVTEDLAPRWIDTEGKVGNIRDCGGYRTVDGRRVRQGLVYRGQGLNDSSATGERPGRCKMTVEDRRYLADTLGIRTDLDLRMPLETGQMTESPLGPNVRYVQRTSECYRGIFTRHGKKAMAENFREFCDRKNYPIYFHCRDGADRTGALAYVLNGLLGVSRRELETDWESTFYPSFPDDNPDKSHWRRMSHLVDGFSKYGKPGDSWNRRIELYLLDCGVTEDEIRRVREIMLESSADVADVMTEAEVDRLCPPRPETAAKFNPDAYPGPARPYREAAKMIYGYMTSLPAMTALVETGRPHQKYQHNAYVSKTHAAHVQAMLRWAKLEPGKRETAMAFAKASAEYLLGELEPPDAPLAYWPPTYGRKPLAFDPKTDGPDKRDSMIGNEPEAAVKYRGEVMLVYPSDVGTAFVAYYEATKDARFLAAARGIAGTYLRTRRADGSWPLKMKLATGETVGENALVPNRLLTFFERLYAVTGEAKWRTAADKVFAWLEAHPLTDWNWDGQFEDIKPEKPYQNPTKHNACDVMMYMLERFPGDADRLALCRRILEFCEKRFVVWKAPADHPTWPVPSVLEQYSCFTPIDASAAKMIRAYVAMYKAEGRAEDLAKARAIADSLTRQQFPSGRVPTFWDISSGISGETYDWLNCMAASAEALCVVDEASPKPVASTLRLGAPFADGCVLQRDRPVTIWGWAEANARVAVAFAGQSVSATADATGAWRVTLAPMPASKEGREMRVAVTAPVAEGSDGTAIHDVLVGEVWLCSGQSNADCPVWGDNPRYRDALGALTVEMNWKPTVRFVKVPRIAATEPKLDHETVWLKMTPNDFARARNGVLPSAMGTYFALELASALDVPIGVVDCTWGGTNIDAWTPRAGYAKHPELADVAAYPLLGKGAFDAAKKDGFYRNKPFTNGWEQQPSAIWNGMVAGYAPMTCRGMIWYQGCHNAYEYARYADKMQALYDGWSAAFENSEMAFRFAQLAPWGDSIIPHIQMAQARFASAEPHATMAVINDVGNLEDIHPNDKRTVAKRLAVQALRCDYGWAWLKYLSPSFESLSVDGDRVTMRFTDVEDFFLYNPAIGDKSNGFELAGADGVFHPAEIVNFTMFTNVVTKKVSFLGHINGNRLVVRSDKVADPKRVRYLHSRPWYGAIRNEVGLPLGAFTAEAEPLSPEAKLVRDFAGLRNREIIQLTNGVYHITEDLAKPVWLAPSNNQTGEKLVAFALGGKDRVMLDGGGATLVIHGRVVPFAVTNCTRFTVRNLTITTAYPSCAGFTVEAKDDEGFVLAFDKGICPYRVEGGHLVFTLDGHDISTRDGRLSLHALDRMAIHYLMAPDSPGDKSSFPSTFVSAVPTDLGGGRIRFRYVADGHPKCVKLPYAVGEKVVVNLEEKRYRDVFFFEDCKDAAVENVTIRRFGGMGVVAQRCDGVKVDGLVVEPPEGERVSVTADVMQFVNCCGAVTVENCRSGFSLDDVINIHGNYLALEAVKGREIDLRTKHRSHEGFFPYRAGDALEFVNAHTREVLAKAKVASVSPDASDRSLCRVTVDAELPALPQGTLVENATLNPDVTIRGNDFHDHPNLRISGRGKMLVEGNRISRCVSALVGMDLADYWYESGRIADLTVRDNDFIDCNRLGGSVFLEFGVSGWGADAPKIHDRIRIEGNRFEGVRGTKCRVSGVADFKEER